MPERRKGLKFSLQSQTKRSSGEDEYCTPSGNKLCYSNVNEVLCSNDSETDEKEHTEISKSHSELSDAIHMVENAAKLLLDRRENHIGKIHKSCRKTLQDALNIRKVIGEFLPSLDEHINTLRKSLGELERDLSSDDKNQDSEKNNTELLGSDGGAVEKVPKKTVLVSEHEKNCAVDRDYEISTGTALENASQDSPNPVSAEKSSVKRTLKNNKKTKAKSIGLSSIKKKLFRPVDKNGIPSKPSELFSERNPDFDSFVDLKSSAEHISTNSPVYEKKNDISQSDIDFKSKLLCDSSSEEEIETRYQITMSSDDIIREEFMSCSPAKENVASTSTSFIEILGLEKFKSLLLGDLSSDECDFLAEPSQEDLLDPNRTSSKSKKAKREKPSLLLATKRKRIGNKTLSSPGLQHKNTRIVLQESGSNDSLSLDSDNDSFQTVNLAMNRSSGKPERKCMPETPRSSKRSTDQHHNSSKYCEICCKLFQTAIGRNRHFSLVHRKGKDEDSSFDCPHEDCDYRSKTRYSVKRHFDNKHSKIS